MSNTIEFNPALPLISATEFLAGNQQVKVGDTVDWKKLGVSEEAAREWLASGMVAHPADSDSDDEHEEHVDETTGQKTRRKKTPTASKAKR